MEYFVGIVLGVAVAVYARVLKMDRERSFYTTVAIVVASYYPLFAVMGASGRTLGIEVIGALAFATLATVGFQRNMMLVALAIGGHGVFDLTLHQLVQNPGMPIWWPGFCSSIDIVMGGWVAVSTQSLRAK